MSGSLETIADSSPSVPPVPAVPPTAPTGAAPREPGLKQRAVRSVMWTLSGQGVSQVIRFGSNLLLAWLLAPHVFGLMALVNTFMVGLEMFSDIGITPGIIRSKRGGDTRFLNTAWTMQIVRGFVLWGAACAIAWPVSRVWPPELLYLLPVAGLQSVIAGFASTSLATLSRKLMIGRLTLLSFARQVISVAVMVGWALFEREVLHKDPTVWALVAGNLAGMTARVVASHALLPGIRHRLTWDPAAARELMSFGQWIFLSTVVTFFAMQTDKLLFEPLMGAGGTALLGVYWFASQFVQQVPTLASRLNSLVGFPALSEVHRTSDHARFVLRMRQVRAYLVLPTTACLILAGLVGPFVMEWLYPNEYVGVGWMISTMVIGALAGTVNTSYGSAWMATGQTAAVLATNAAQFALVVACGLIGHRLAGLEGFVFGASSVQWLLYPVTAALAIRGGVWQPKLDFLALGIGVAGAAALLTLHGVHGPWGQP